MLVQSLYFSHKIYFPLTNFKFPVWTSHSSWNFYIPHANFISLEQCFHFFDTKLTSKANGLKRYIFFFPLGTYLFLSYDLREMCLLTCCGRKENISCSLASFCEIAPKASDESRTYIDAHDDWFVQVPTSQGQSCVQMPYPSAGIDLQFSCKKQD